MATNRNQQIRNTVALHTAIRRKAAPKNPTSSNGISHSTLSNREQSRIAYEKKMWEKRIGSGKNSIGDYSGSNFAAPVSPDSLKEQAGRAANPLRWARGAWDFGWEVGESGAGLGRFGFDFGKELASTVGIGKGSGVDDRLRREYPNYDQMSEWQQAQLLMRQYMPLVNDIGAGVMETGRNIRHPERYKEAIREGRIVDTIISDIGNLALVGGVAGRALSAGGRVTTAAATPGSQVARAGAGLQTAGRGITRASTLGASVEDVPVWLARKALNNRLTSAAIQRSNITNVIPALNPEVRRKRAFANEENRITTTEAFPLVRKTQRTIQPLDRDTRIATGLERQGLNFLADVTAYAPDRASAQRILDATADFDRPGATRMDASDRRHQELYEITPESTMVLADRLKDKLDPKKKAGYDKAIALLDDTEAKRNALAMKYSNLHPEQFGDEVMPHYVEDKMRPIESKIQTAIKRRDEATASSDKIALQVEKIKAPYLRPGPMAGQSVIDFAKMPTVRARALGSAEKMAELAARKADRKTQVVQRLIDKATAERAKLEASPEAMPARFATVHRIGNRLAEAIDKEVADLRAQGIDTRDLEMLANNNRNLSMEMMKERGINPHHLIGGDQMLLAKKSKGPNNNLLPKGSLEGTNLADTKQRLAEKISFDAELQMKNEIFRRRGYARNRALEGFVNLFAQPASDVLLQKFTPDQIARMSPIEIYHALTEMEYVGYSPGQLWAKLPPDVHKLDTLVLQDAVHRDYTSGRVEDPVITQIMGKLNRSWKNTVLPFSIRWHIGNAAGGFIMATVGGGVTPIDMVRAAAEMRKQLKAARKTDSTITRREILPPELQGMSLMAEERRFVDPNPTANVGLPTQAFRSLIGSDKVTPSIGRKVVGKMYGANDAVDSFYRSAVYLTKVRKGVGREAAIKSAINTMGDYGRLTTFERRWVVNALPFYPWLKHITTLTMRLPVEHPMRVVWTMKLGAMFGDDFDEDSEDLPPWQVGSIKLAGRTLDQSIFNPFSDAGASLNPENLGSQASPFLKIAAGATIGLNLNDFDQIKRPDETGRIVDSGALWRDPEALGEFAISNVSLAKNLRDLITGDEIRRFSTGEPRYVRTPNGNNRNYIDYPEYDEFGVLRPETRLARGPDGRMVLQPDVEERSTINRWDTLGRIFGVTARDPEQFVHRPLHHKGQITDNGMYITYIDQDGRMQYMRKSDGAVYTRPDTQQARQEEVEESNHLANMLRVRINGRGNSISRP